MRGTNFSMPMAALLDSERFEYSSMYKSFDMCTFTTLVRELFRRSSLAVELCVSFRGTLAYWCHLWNINKVNISKECFPNAFKCLEVN